MKKALTLFVLIVTPAIAFAQGTVVFSNNGSSLVKQWTSLYDSTLISVPKSGGSVELIVAPEGTPLSNPFGYTGISGFSPMYSSLAGFFGANPGWSAVSITSILPIVAGEFNGGVVTINGIAAGAGAEYFVIGWTGPYTTYDAAFAACDFYNAFFGVSAIATTSTGNPRTTPPGIPVPLQTTFPGMLLAPQIMIPEPATAALAGLGAVMLMVFRRRR